MAGVGHEGHHHLLLPLFTKEVLLLFITTGPPLLSMVSHCLPRATMRRGRECRTAGLPAARDRQEGRTGKGEGGGSTGGNSLLQETEIVPPYLYLTGRLGDERTLFF